MPRALPHSLIVLGKLTFEPTDPPLPFGTYIIQRVAPGCGNISADPTRSLQIRRHVLPVDPNTTGQQTNRQKVRDGVTAWHALDTDQKTSWAQVAKARNITGFNAYLSAWLRGEIVASGLTWDGGASIWDGGATSWAS